MKLARQLELDIRKCQETVDSYERGQACRLLNELIASYEQYLPRIRSGLSLFFPGGSDCIGDVIKVQKDLQRLYDQLKQGML